MIEIEAARNRLILAPAQEKDEAWADLYVLVVGPPPPGSKPLKEVIV